MTLLATVLETVLQILDHAWILSLKIGMNLLELCVR
jgi:hypothetical protein